MVVAASSGRPERARCEFEFWTKRKESQGVTTPQDKMMPHGGMMMAGEERDPIAEDIDTISLCQYKHVQTMATERKLPANLKVSWRRIS